MADDRPVPEMVPAEAFAGVPDGLERLWTPHRAAYLGGENKPVGDDAAACPFCRAAAADDDAAHLVVARGTRVFALLNLYPYNSGHLMVLPYRHVGDITELDAQETAELGSLTQTAVRVLRDVYQAQGFNLGVNQGTAAGAGIAAHLHQHVVPRWTGDANFMPVIARTKTLPEILADTRERLVRAWPPAPDVAADPSGRGAPA